MSCHKTLMVMIGLGLLGESTGCDSADQSSADQTIAPRKGSANEAPQGPTNLNTGSYNLHLEDTLRFQRTQPGGNPDMGRARFGLAPDENTIDPTNAVFEGESVAFRGEVVSNGRSCATCHRGRDLNFGMPPLPFSDTIPSSDPLFTGLDADAQQDPDGAHNLDQLGLFKYRPNRFNVTLDEEDPFRQVFFWRKSPQMLNVAFSQGFLLDGRARVMFETARGAVFSHTQESDGRFDDLFTLQDGNDIEAFLFGLVSDDRLLALRQPDHPLHDPLSEDPFYTVDLQTQEQRRGAQVFEKNCMGCHSTPNVFNNLAHVEPLGAGDRPVNFPSWAPSVGRTFNIGVAERNVHDLRFTLPIADAQFESIVLPLVNADGSVEQHEVQFDVGLAATTARAEDVGRFKVPQLRNLLENAPYFHDNSAATIEEALDHHLSEWYANSPDGQRHPIGLNQRQRDDILELLKIL